MKLYKYRKLLALAAAGAIATVGIGAIKTEHARHEVIYTVKEGDTLWNIAKEHKNPDDDIREVIYEIKEDNPQIKEYLQPGQQLKISIKKELADNTISANSTPKK